MRLILNITWGEQNVVVDVSLKTKSVSILSVLIVTVLGSTLILSASPVFANPACGATIKTSTTLTANIGPCSGNGLVIGINGITLDCAGHTISGTGTGNGITFTGHTKVTVKNCKVTGFEYAFYLYGSSKNTLTGNKANSNTNGFFVATSTGNSLNKNAANSNANCGYYDISSSSSLGAPHWGTANSYKGDKGSGNFELTCGNSNFVSATSPF